MHDSITVKSFSKVVEKSKARKSKLNIYYTTIGSVNGYKAEHSIVAAWRPRWRNRQRYSQLIKLVRPSTPFEDHILKYDVVFETYLKDKPLIGLQSKTNYQAYLKFIEDYPEIPAVYMTAFESPEMIRKRSLFAILQKFPELIPKMQLLGCQVPLKLREQLDSVSKYETLLVI